MEINSLKKKLGDNGGITLIEVLVVVVVCVIISTVMLLSLIGSKGKTELDATVKQMGSLLREAQSRSMSQASSSSWGVHFDNSVTPGSYSLFFSNYSTSTIIGFYSLPNTLRYDTSTIPLGSSTDIKFDQLTGKSAYNLIKIYILSRPSLFGSLRVATSGSVSF